MSETTAAPAATENAEAQTQGDPAGKPLGPNGEKALADERAARKAAEKSAAELKARLDKIEAANLSDLERAQKAAQDAQAELERVTRENLRNTVALAKGVPADLAPFLNGDTEDDLNAQADTLLARLNAPTSPRPDPTQAAGGGEPHALNSDGLERALKSKLGIS